MLPAHLMGNMWQQDWGNLWDMLQPYQGAGSLDITGALESSASRTSRAEAGQARRRSPTAEQLVEIERAAQTWPPPRR